MRMKRLRLAETATNFELFEFTDVNWSFGAFLLCFFVVVDGRGRIKLLAL